MAVSEQVPYIEHIGNGVTTSFALGFDCSDKNHLIVMIDDFEPAVDTWSLSDGAIVFSIAPELNKKISIKRNTPFRRDSDFQSYDNSFRPKPVNKDFDWIWWKLQELGVADWILGNRIDALKSYVDRKDDELKNYLIEEIRKQGVALDQLDEYYNYLMQRLAQIAVDKGWDASFVVDGDKTQKQINDYQSIKNSLSVDLLDFIPKSEWSNIVKRISSYDCTQSLISAQETGKQVKVSTAGTYVFKTSFATTNDFNLNSKVDGIIFDLSQMPTNTNFGFSINGNVTQIANLSTNVVKGSRQFSLVDASNVSAGDWICLYNPIDFSYSGWRNYYRAGEWKRVLAKFGNTLVTDKPFYDSYDVDDIDVYKMNSKNVSITGNKIKFQDKSGNVAHLIKISLCANPEVNIGFEMNKESAIFFDRCVEPKSRNAEGFNFGRTNGTTDYGILISNSQHARIFGGVLYGKRHAIAVGGGNEVCSVPVRDFRCYDATCSNDPELIIGATDMHGNVEDSSYEGCIVYGGTNIGGGGDNYYKKCVIKSNATNGRIGYLREIKGGRFGYIDCISESFANPQAQVHGVFDGGGNSDVLTANTVSDVDFIVSGGSIKSNAWTPATQLMVIRNAGASVKINPEVNGLNIRANALHSIIRTSLTGGVANSDRIIVDNITGTMPTNAIVSHAGGAYLNAPHRIQRQSGIVSLTTIAQAVTTAQTQIFKFSYPRIPSSQLSLRGTNGASSGFGGQVVMAHCLEINVNSIRPQVKAPSAMIAGDTFEICWSVELSEC